MSFYAGILHRLSCVATTRVAIFVGASLRWDAFLFVYKEELEMSEETKLSSLSVDILPCEYSVDLTDIKRFTKLELTVGQKMQINALLGELPSLTAGATLAKAYVATFPDGLPHTLMQLHQGGVSSYYQVDGKFAGTASLYSTSAQAACLGAFTAMSVASGQYFLAEINSKLNVMQLSLDKILEFLYGDKRAELMSEINFARFAYQNYGSIMEHGQQRMATIAGLQNGRKIAIKDIEFYLSDLSSTVSTKDDSDISITVTKAIQIKECLDLSIQLYVMSNLLEVFYSQNHDKRFLQYIEDDVATYVTKCDKRMLTNFSKLQQSLTEYKGKPFKKIDKDLLENQIGEIVEELNTSENSPMQELLHTALRVPEQRTEYYFNDTGDVYLKVL